MGRVLAGVLLVVFAASPAAAQSSRPPAPTYSEAPLSPALSWEARLGLAAANPGGREEGLLNFSGEMLSPRLATSSDRIAGAFVPRFHLGSSINFNGTRYAYAGATWTFDLSQIVFVEASLGAARNDGKTGQIIPENRLAVGCQGGTREAAAVGMRLSDRWSLVATLEHFSATGCGDKPRGPANFGARLGYTF